MPIYGLFNAHLNSRAPYPSFAAKFKDLKNKAAHSVGLTRERALMVDHNLFHAWSSSRLTRFIHTLGLKQLYILSTYNSSWVDDVVKKACRRLTKEYNQTCLIMQAPIFNTGDGLLYIVNNHAPALEDVVTLAKRYPTNAPKKLIIVRAVNASTYHTREVASLKMGARDLNETFSGGVQVFQGARTIPTPPHLQFTSLTRDANGNDTPILLPLFKTSRVLDTRPPAPQEGRFRLIPEEDPPGFTLHDVMLDWQRAAIEAPLNRGQPRPIRAEPIAQYVQDLNNPVRRALDALQQRQEQAHDLQREQPDYEG